jgi:hypothetical protein
MSTHLRVWISVNSGSSWIVKMPIENPVTKRFDWGWYAAQVTVAGDFRK